MKFLIETDRKPIVPLLGNKHLDSLPPRILRFRLRLARFDYSIIHHVPGKLLYTPDTLSRIPSPSQENDKRLQEKAEEVIEAGEKAEEVIEVCVSHLPASRAVREKYRKAQLEDLIWSSVIKHCQNGWPEKDKVQPDLKPFWNAQGELTVDSNDLLLYDKRIVVPKILQR